MGSEADIAVIFGIILLAVWLEAFLPSIIMLCKRCYLARKMIVIVPIVLFVLLFSISVIIMGWDNFIGYFGTGSNIVK